MKTKQKILVKTLLLLSGIIALGIGGALLFLPVAFEAGAGIDLGGDISLLSEVRAPGGALLIGGILIILGAFNSQMTFLSITLSSLFYISYGLSRVLSVIIDGIPHESLVMATITELVIGFFSLLVLVNFPRKREQLV